MKYLLINQKTGEETLCDKVTVDGFEYYACRGETRLNDPITDKYRVWFWEDNCSLLGTQKVIATNNPNVNIPKVVDDDEEIVNYSENLAKSLYNPEAHRNESIKSLLSVACQSGYNKSQETHPFSEGDMVEFADWVDNMGYRQVANGLYKSINDEKGKLTKELLQLWKFQQPKKVYYEK
jgi:hypothetical protein